MKIIDELIEPYSITIDSENFTVGIEKKYEKNDGESYTVQQNQTFHASLESALKKIIRHKIADEESTVGLEQFAEKYRKLSIELSDKLGNLEKLPKERSEEE